MHIGFDITIRFLDIFIIGYFAYMFWIGSKQGPIVRAIDLFAFSAGILLSSLITRSVYYYFYRNNAVHPELFAALILIVLYSGSLWFSYLIQKTVYSQTKDLEKGKKASILGGILSLIKAIIVAGVFTLILLSLNVSGKFLPKEEPKSALGYITSSTVALTIRNFYPLYKSIYSKIGKKPIKRNNKPVNQTPTKHTQGGNPPQSSQIPVINSPKDTIPVVQPQNDQDNF